MRTRDLVILVCLLGIIGAAAVATAATEQVTLKIQGLTPSG